MDKIINEYYVNITSLHRLVLSDVKIKCAFCFYI